MAKNSTFTTLYDPKQAGTLAFSARDELETDIQSYLDVVRQLQEDFANDPALAAGLGEIEVSLNALRISRDADEVLRAKLDQLVSVPLGGDKSLKLAGFRKSSAKATLSNMSEYGARVRKLVRNTMGNLTQLLLTWPDDAILQRFLKHLLELENEQDAKVLQVKMSKLSGSPQLWHYNERKKSFLVEWLRPYQELFDVPIEQLSEQDIQAALAKVAALREERLEDMTNLELYDERRPFRIHNRSMHPIMNGRNAKFWGTAAVRDEFVSIMQALLNRFSINLEERFLLFRTRDGTFCYLVGFADEAFDNMLTLEDGKLGLYPHVKVFFKGEGGAYSELTEAVYGNDATAYFKALQTAVVPFITSIAVMLEVELTPAIKDAFDMWT